MSLPIQIKFFKKIELYQELKELNKKFEKKHPEWKIWNTEKAILSWYANELVALSTEVSRDKIRRAVLKEGTLDLMQISQEYDIHLNIPIENLIARGYAVGNSEKIAFTAEGLLMGRVINEVRGKLQRLFYTFLYYLVWVTVLMGAFIIIGNFIRMFC